VVARNKKSMKMRTMKVLSFGFQVLSSCDSCIWIPETQNQQLTTTTTITTAVC